MKRPRRPPHVPRALSPAILARALGLLLADYIAILDGSAGDDPKRIAQRVAAAGEVLDQIRLLAELAGGAADPARTDEEVLAEAREVMADENKS